jgi:steroid delta-isomerase-like uncharacterized protein
MGNGEKVIRDWFQKIWNEGRLEMFSSLAQPDIVFHSMSMDSGRLVGLEGFRAHYEPIRTAFSDIAFSIGDIVESEDVTAVRWICSMRHTGQQLGIPASQKPVRLTGMAFIRMKDGKIAEAWDEWDRVGLMKQIGIPLQ